MAEIPAITKIRKERHFVEGMNNLTELAEDQLRKSFDLVTSQEYAYYYFSRTDEFAKALGIANETIATSIFGSALFLVGAIFISGYSVEDVIESLKPILDTEEKINKLTNVLRYIAVSEVKDKARSMHVAQQELRAILPNVTDCEVFYSFDKRAIFVDDNIKKFIPLIMVSLKHNEKVFTFQSTIESFEDLIEKFKKMLSLAKKLKE